MFPHSSTPTDIRFSPPRAATAIQTIPQEAKGHEGKDEVENVIRPVPCNENRLIITLRFNASTLGDLHVHGSSERFLSLAPWRIRPSCKAVGAKASADGRTYR